MTRKYEKVQGLLLIIKEMQESGTGRINLHTGSLQGQKEDREKYQNLFSQDTTLLLYTPSRKRAHTQATG